MWTKQGRQSHINAVLELINLCKQKPEKPLI